MDDGVVIRRMNDAALEAGLMFLVFKQLSFWSWLSLVLVSEAVSGTFEISMFFAKRWYLHVVLKERETRLLVTRVVLSA